MPSIAIGPVTPGNVTINWALIDKVRAERQTAGPATTTATFQVPVSGSRVLSRGVVEDVQRGAFTIGDAHGVTTDVDILRGGGLLSRADLVRGTYSGAAEAVDGALDALRGWASE